MKNNVGMKQIQHMFITFIAFVVLGVLAGCGNAMKHDDGMIGMDMGSSDDRSLTPIRVQILLPNELHAGQKETLQIKVTQGDEPVDDAKEVIFEVWNGNDTNHLKLEAQYTADGIYSAETKFEQAGDYHIIAHVSARNLHTMPQKDFKVGSA